MAAKNGAPKTDRDCWPFPCRDYHDTYAHQSGEDPCTCSCHGGKAVQVDVTPRGQRMIDRQLAGR